MDITTLLEKDHREIEGLFGQVETAQHGGGAGKAAICERLFDALDLHARIEEAIFYPDLEPSLVSGKVEEAYQEHAQAKELIARLRSLGPDADEFDELLLALRENVAHHVAAEEATLFSAAREALGNELLDRAGNEATELREQFERRAASELHALM